VDSEGPEAAGSVAAVDAPKPLPLLTDTNRFFWTSGEDGVLRFLRCRSCGAFVHPPTPGCRACLGDDLAPEAVSGRARVVGWTVDHQPWHPAFPPPYVIAVVALEEDPAVRLTTNLVDVDPDDVGLGTPVEVVFEHHDDVWLPLFRPVGADR
jgi:uncharacterized OB-fold protein